MQAVILAGGVGTRLRPYTMVLPKPMMPIGEKPILEIVIQKLADAGIKSIVLSVGYLEGIIRAYFGNGEKFGVDIEYFTERKPLGTAGCLALIENLEDEFIVANGDVLTSLDFGDLLEHHRSHSKKVTICTYNKEVTISLGVLELNGDIVEDYIEKPTFKYSVSMGIYVMNRDIVEHIPKNEYFDLPTLIKKLISQKEPINVYKFEGEWHDIGREEDYKAVLDKFSNDR
jgi:NDP-sugar pyrophosphorylase family protein